jgi:myo-inositol-1(or 4)-monophosphatase
MIIPDAAELRELEVLIRRAGDCLLQHWPGGNHTLQNIQTKNDGTSVTEADFASNRILTEGLAELFPLDGLISEEGKHEDAPLKHSRVWIIDPLDGTRSFIEGRDDFSILMGLVVNGRAEFGLMYFPVKKLLARADQGAGAILNGKASRVSTTTQLKSESVYFRNFEPRSREFVYGEYMDSGMALLNLGCGRFDGLIIRMTRHKEWDIAAPAAFLRESGARISDENGAEILFNQGGINYRYFVASNGLLHQDVLNLIPPD